MMNKKIITCVFTVLALDLTVLYATELQLWTNFSIASNINSNVTTSFNQEMRYKDDIQNFYYAHFEPAILLKTFSLNSFGFEMRGIFNKNSNYDWVFEARPTIIFYTTILKADKFTLHSRVRVYGRLKSGMEKSIGALRTRIGLDFFKKKNFKFYITDELFYNHQNFQAIDRNRLALGFQYKITQQIYGKFYYLRQEDKQSPGFGWRGFNILGLAFTAKY